MSTKITYKDKVAIQNDPEIPEENKVTDEDMNNIKNAVNANADELDDAKKTAEQAKETAEGIKPYDDTELKQDISNLKQEDIKKDKEIEGLKAKDNELNTTIIDLKNKAGNKLSLEIDPVNYIMTLKLLNQDDVELDSKTIDFPLESVVVNGKYENGNVVLTLQNETEITIPIGELVNGLVSQETFDTAVKDLQSKIDECVKTTDFQESQEKQDQKILSLQQENEMLKNLLPTVSGKGESVILKGTGKMPFKKFQVGGNSWQETREGYNLFIPTLQNESVKINQVNCTVSLIEDEFTFNATGKDMYFGSTWSGGTEYKNNFGVKINVEGKNNLSFLVTNSEFNNNFITAFNKEDVALENKMFSTNKGTYTVPENTSFVVFRFGKKDAVEGQTYKTKVMIHEGTEEKPYEKYGAMPSPEFQSSIRNCGDNINLFNEDDSWITASTSVVKADLIEGETYAVKIHNPKEDASYIVKGGTSSSSYVNFQNTCNKNNNYTGTFTYNIDENNRNSKNGIYLRETIGTSFKWLNSEEIKELQIKIEKGTKSTPYSKYGCGNLNIGVCNKNLVDINKFESTYITKRTENSITQNFTSRLQGGGEVKIPLLNKKYLASINIPNGNSARVELRFFKDDTIISNDTKTFATTFKIDNTSGKYDYMTYRLSNGDEIGEITFENPQVEIIENDSNSPSEYVLHQEQLKNFPLEKGQVFHLEDYLASDGIHQTRNTKELDGTEDIRAGGSAVNQTCSAWFLRVSDASDEYSQAISTHLKGGVTETEFNSVYLLPNQENPAIRFAIDNNLVPYSTTSGDNMKNYLAEQKANGTPVIVEYKLKEEKIIPYTPEQRKAYDEIMQLTSYEDTTHVFSEDEISPIFDVTAYAKITTNEQTNEVQSEPTSEPSTYEEPSMEENEVEEVV